MGDVIDEKDTDGFSIQRIECEPARRAKNEPA
jgi:hypothetical protein